MTSDYFIVPMFPDYFSAMAIESLASILPKWSAWARQGKALPVLREAVYPFPDRVPKFLGTIIQNYRVRKGLPASAFQQWFDEIGKGIVSSLIPVLTDNEMLLSLELYDKAPKSASHPPIQPSFFPEFVYDSVVSRPLLQVPDFNSLIARSQEHNAPVFDLTDEQLQSRWRGPRNHQEVNESVSGPVCRRRGPNNRSHRRMLNSIEQFREDIGRVRAIGGLYGALGQISVPVLDETDLLRAQFVMAVSALDRYIHEITRVGMLESYDE